MTITDGLKPYFKLAALLGVGAMVFDTWLSGKFGWTISADMAGIFALVSLASGVLLVIAAAFWRSGHVGIAKGIAIAWAPIFAFNVLSNMGVATANRMTDVHQATVQQTKFESAQDSAKEAATNLKLWTSQLAKLKADNAWVASVTADSLRGQLAELQAAADRESRRGGCGSKCEAIKAQVRDVQSRIGAAEQRDDLTKRIAATENLVAKYREKAATTEAGTSQALNQSTFFGKLMRASLYSSPDAQDIAVANEGMGMFTALVLALVSALLTYVGAYPHLQEIRPGQSTTGFVRGKEPTAETAAPAPPASHTIVQVTDSAWDKLIANLRANPTTAALL
jgi:hypothetical protein